MTRRQNLTSLGARAVSVGALLAAASATALATDVNGVITSDNAYGFGFGDEFGLTTYFGGIRNTTAGEITNGLPVLFNAGDSNAGNGYTNPGIGPELYDLDGVPTGDYMYVVSWPDDTSFQGTIASFTVGAQSLSTNPGQGWEVFATGEDLDSQFAGDTLTNDASDIAMINSQILTANAASGGSGTSLGWVDETGTLSGGGVGSGALVFGDANDGLMSGTHPFGVINGIESSAQWMWYNEDPSTISNPFQAGPEGADGHHEFLIFRIPLSNIPAPGTSALLLMGAAACTRRRR